MVGQIDISVGEPNMCTRGRGVTVNHSGMWICRFDRAVRQTGLLPRHGRVLRCDEPCGPQNGAVRLTMVMVMTMMMTMMECVPDIIASFHLSLSFAVGFSGAKAVYG